MEVLPPSLLLGTYKGGLIGPPPIPAPIKLPEGSFSIVLITDLFPITAPYELPLLKPAPPVDVIDILGAPIPCPNGLGYAAPNL